jgi:hypothetical protein
MRVNRNVAQGVVAVGVAGVSAEIVPHVANIRESSRDVIVVVAVRPVCKVVRLANVDRVGVVSAVARVVAHGLHFQLPDQCLSCVRLSGRTHSGEEWAHCRISYICPPCVHCVTREGLWRRAARTFLHAVIMLLL